MNTCPLCNALVTNVAAHFLVCPVATADLEDQDEKALLGEISSKLDAVADKKAGR